MRFMIDKKTNSRPSASMKFLDTWEKISGKNDAKVYERNIFRLNRFFRIKNKVREKLTNHETKIKV